MTKLRQILTEAFCVKCGCEAGSHAYCKGKCAALDQAEAQILALLPTEMADTKITPERDKFHYGYNSAVKEAREEFVNE